jgi:hypothetical protein
LKKFGGTPARVRGRAASRTPLIDWEGARQPTSPEEPPLPMRGLNFPRRALLSVRAAARDRAPGRPNRLGLLPRGNRAPCRGGGRPEEAPLPLPKNGDLSRSQTRGDTSRAADAPAKKEISEGRVPLRTHRLAVVLSLSSSPAPPVRLFTSATWSCRSEKAAKACLADDSPGAGRAHTRGPHRQLPCLCDGTSAEIGE